MNTYFPENYIHDIDSKDSFGPKTHVYADCTSPQSSWNLFEIWWNIYDICDHFHIHNIIYIKYHYLIFIFILFIYTWCGKLYTKHTSSCAASPHFFLFHTWKAAVTRQGTTWPKALSCSSALLLQGSNSGQRNGNISVFLLLLLLTALFSRRLNQPGHRGQTRLENRQHHWQGHRVASKIM